jgi:cell division protease FtsH
VERGTDSPPRLSRRVNEHSVALAREWRRLGRVATFVAVLTSPALFVALYQRAEWPLAWALLGTIIGIAAFRGLIDVLAHKLIPAPSLYGAERELRDEDVVPRRRL